MNFLTLTAFSNFIKLREYQPLSLTQNPIASLAFYNGYECVSCEMAHVLYEPMLVQITFAEKPKNHTKGSIQMPAFDNPNKISAILHIELQQEVSIETETLFFYKVINSEPALSLLKKLYVKRLYQNSIKKNSNFMQEFSMTTYLNLISLFSSPKQVWLVSIRENATFPVDLYAKHKNLVTIGVRNSNHSIQELVAGDSFYVSSAAAEDYKKIYALGKFLNVRNTVSTIQIESDFHIPEVVCAGQKLVLLQKIVFEHQTLYISKIAQTIVINKTKKPLYHIHKIWLWNKTNYLKVEK